MDTTDALTMARQLVAYHLPNSRWTVVLDNARARFGCCKYAKQQISLSRHWLALSDRDEVRQTVLHEIAHAIVGGEAGHGPVWRAKMLDLGATPQRCSNRARQLPPRWIAECPTCGEEYGRNRRPTYSTACGKHGRRFSADHALTWRANTDQRVPA